jgi:hypothetical protein
VRPDLEKLKREFQTGEFQYLSASILLLVESQFKLERYTLAGIAAIYGWLFTRQPLKALPVQGDISPYGIYVFWIPPFLILFAMLRSASLLFTLEMTYAYIKKIELDLLGETGWQGFALNSRKQKWRVRMFRWSLTIFWFSILIISSLIAWYFAPLRL